MASTLKDVAALSGVHPSTVSRVLHGKENIPISEETRKRILDAAEKLHYSPDQTARALRLKKSDAIGLIIPDISNTFFASIAHSIGQQSYNTGYTLYVCDTDEDQSKEVRFVNELVHRGVDGLIIAPAQDSDEHIRDLRDNNFPFVLIDRCFEELETNAVISDNENASFRVVAHFVELGHKRIAFLSGRQTIYTIQKRLAGYRKAISEFHLCNDPDLISGNGFTLEDGYRSTLHLLSLHNPPTAILASGNIISIGAIKAIIETGLSIPQDISLVGFTDNVLSPYLVCSLSTVSHALQEIGKRAFNLLLEHVEAKESLPCSRITIETQFNIRNSTDRAPIFA